MWKLTIVVLLTAAACGGPPYRAREKEPDRIATADSTVLVALDDGVKGAIELLDHQELVMADGRLRAQVRFVNRTSHQLELQVAWSFKDDQGLAVEPDSPFVHLFVAAGQTVDLARESIAAGAVAFHVQAKSARSAQR